MHGTLGLLQSVGIGLAAIVVVAVVVVVLFILMSAIKIVKECGKRGDQDGCREDFSSGGLGTETSERRRIRGPTREASGQLTQAERSGRCGEGVLHRLHRSTQGGPYGLQGGAP